MAPRKSFWRSLQRTFVTGLVVLAPLVVTGMILHSLYQYVQARSPFGFIGGTLLTVIIVGLIILIVGWLSRTAFGTVLEWAEEAVLRVPAVGGIYKSLRDMVKAVSGEEHLFRHPVWIHPIPGSKLKVIGFITRDDLTQIGAKGELAVYVPLSYNISGTVIVVPRSMVKPMKTPGGDAFAFVATGGLTGAQKHKS